jgi:uncharacterized protein with GYD domain
MYLLLVKINPGQTSDCVKALRNLPEKPTTGVTLYYTYNAFGTWDCCMWFEAGTHDNAMNFVQNKIRPIDGVIETHTIPTTPIKEYKTW